MSDENIPLPEEWWMDDQKELIEDSSRCWIKKTFRNVQGFWIVKDGHRILGKVSQHEELPPGAVLAGRAWDHEHCALCWETISEHERYQHDGYTDGKVWLCTNCFNKYIAPRRNQSED